jgi:formylmethanofuran dehydrogenase subunit E
MYKKDSQESVETKLKDLAIKYKPFTYRNAHQKIEFYCSKCGDVCEREIADLTRGRTKCPKCSGNVKLTQNEVEIKLKEYVEFLPFTYTGQHQKIMHKCPQCGKLKESQIVHILNGTVLCGDCSGKGKRTQKQAEKELQDLGIEYEPFVYKNNETTIRHKCSTCGIVKHNKFISLINGKGLRCEKCGHDSTTKSQTRTQEESEIQLKELGIDFMPYVYTIGKETDISIRCKSCGKYFNTKFSHVVIGNRRYCKHCNKSTSEQENELKNFIKSLNIEIQENVKVGGKEIDILIPSLQIGFEYNGSYWHNDINKPKTHHYDKATICQNENIRLIYIWDYEWLNNMEETKSYIKYQLGVYDIITHDGSIIKDIVTPAERQVHLGLYIKNEKILSILFNKNLNNIEWEMIPQTFDYRYDIKSGIILIFNSFIEKYNPITIITYLDRSKFSEDFYQNTPLKLKHIVDTNYNWVFKENLLLKEQNINTDKEMKKLYENGKVFRIYDAGKYCYIWQR